MATLTALNRQKKLRLRSLSGELSESTVFNRKNSGVNAIVPEKKAVLTAFNRTNSGVNGVELKK